MTHPVLSNELAAKPHAVFLPCPAQSHINANLKLAKLLHWKGFHITFVNTEFNHGRMVRARGGSSFLDGLPSDFQFLTIPDGLPPSDANATQDFRALCESFRNLMRAPFAELVGHLNQRAALEQSFPAVSCLVSDGLMTFSAIPAGEKFGVPVVSFHPISASTVMCLLQYPELLKKGFIPMKDVGSASSEYLDTIIDRIPGMKNMRLRDLPAFVQNTAVDDDIFHICMDAMKTSEGAVATIIHTFEDLELDVLDALSTMQPNPVYAIGPMSLLLERIPEEENQTKDIRCNLWEENTECLRWLDTKEPCSVVYINFGSIASLTPQQAGEFAMGIADSGHSFLWIIRPDLVTGEGAILPREFAERTRGRGFTAEWCPQEVVLDHPSVGGFLTHCGWNSTIESLSAGVPMLCWPCFGDQQSNCRLVCTKWENGLEIGNGVKRDEVTSIVKQLMEGDKGRKMKERAVEWKKLAEEAAGPSGSSSRALDRLIRETLWK